MSSTPRSALEKLWRHAKDLGQEDTVAGIFPTFNVKKNFALTKALLRLPVAVRSQITSHHRLALLAVRCTDMKSTLELSYA